MKEIAQTRRRGVSAWDGQLIRQAALQSFPKLDPSAVPEQGMGNALIWSV
jgi:hypothetical protein